MQYSEFVQRVKDRIGITSTSEAEIAINATLTTLGERITGGEANDLAAQLPEELKDPLTSSSSSEAEDFGLAEFYRRVTEREGLSVKESTEHARAVMGALSEAASGGELRDVQSQLPKEFDPLFG
ncbi:MAG: DUF2267 domain-containing protein [Rubrobacter sp.]|nr:DUF2267 domain-containing protein [Rubrobacter sp.]